MESLWPATLLIGNGLQADVTARRVTVAYP